MRVKLLMFFSLSFCLSVLAGGNFVQPFRAEALSFYFIHGGGSLRLSLKIRAEEKENPSYPRYLSRDGAFVGRIFDAEEKLVHWDYRRVRAGAVEVLSYDFGTKAPAGIYQIRYSGCHILAEVESVPECRFALSPMRCLLHSTVREQFSRAWIYMPENLDTLKIYSRGTDPVLKDAAGKLRGQGAEKKGISLASGKGEVWSLAKSMTPGLYECVGFSHPLLLCPDKETAQKLRGSLEKTEDGVYYPHKFQLAMHRWLKEARKSDLKIRTVPLKKFLPEMAKDPSVQGLIGPWGLLTYLNHVIDSQNIDPNSADFCRTPYCDLLLAAYALNKPYNPYYKNPALEKRFLIPVFEDLLKLTENDTWDGGFSNYSGGTALGYAPKIKNFFLVYAELKKNSPELAELWLKAIRRTADRFSMFRVSCENQSSHWPFVYTCLYQITGDARYRAMAMDFLQGMSREGGDPSMQTGYLQEAYGPDATYQGLGACYLALCHRMLGDPVSKELVKEIYGFFNHSVAPEPSGKVFGSCNFSHRTPGTWVNRQYHAGMQFMKGLLPEAAVWWYNQPAPKPPQQVFQEKNYGRGAIYATHVISPYFYEFKYPSGLFQNARLPVMQSERFFKNFNNEFFAVRRPSYYAFLYAGRTAQKWTAKQRPRTPETPRKPYSKWTQTQGLSLLWFPGYGNLVTALNWNADACQILRADLQNGQCAYPDYWDFSSSQRGEKLLQRGSFFNLEDVRYIRVVTFAEEEFRQKIMVDFSRDIRVRALYEQLPLLLEGKEVKVKYLHADGQWKAESGMASKIRINDAIEIVLSAPTYCDMGNEHNRFGQKVAPLRFHLENSFTAGSRRILSYSIRRISSDRVNSSQSKEMH